MNLKCCNVVIVLLIWSADAVTKEVGSRGDHLKATEDHRNLYETGVAVKEGIIDFRNSIKIVATDFEDLVKNSKVFADKTMLIYWMLNKTVGESPSIAWLAPDGWGKTMNLNMLKTFVEMPVDKQGNVLPVESTFAFRLFMKGEILLDNGVDKLQRGLMITKHEHFILQHLGRYPVIYASFKEAIGDYAGVKETVIGQIRLAFKRHEYMVDVLRKNCDKDHQNWCADLKEFEDFLYSKEYREEDTDKLKFLTRVLYDHFKIKPIILLDNFDTPLRNLLENQHSSSDHLSHLKLLKSLAETFGSGTHFSKAFVTGIFEIEIRELLTKTEHYVVHDYTPWSEYFGFSPRVVHGLFYLHGIEEHTSKDAFRWYGGHKSVLNFCQSSAIVKFLQEEKFKVYLENNRSVEFVTNVLKKQPTLRIPLLRMLSNKSQTLNGDVGIFTLRNISAFGLHNRTLNFDPITEAGFLRYLQNNGYLTKIIGEKKVKVSNMEASAVLCSILISIYKQEYSIYDKLLQDAALHLYEYILAKDNNTRTQFEGVLTDLYQHTSNVNDISDVISVFNCISMYMHSSRVEEIIVYYDKIQKADLVVMVVDKLHAAVIELRYNGTVEKAFESANRFFNVRKLAIMPMIKFIGINVGYDKTVQVLSVLSFTKFNKHLGITTTTEESPQDIMDRLVQEEIDEYGI